MTMYVSGTTKNPKGFISGDIILFENIGELYVILDVLSVDGPYHVCVGLNKQLVSKFSVNVNWMEEREK